MLTRQTQYQNGTHEDDDFDDEGILAASIVEAIQNDDEDPSQTLQTLQSREDDLQSRLQAAATPLEYQASLEARYASYDNYCSLFHFILNSNGPVELDLPTYYWAWDVIDEFIYQFNNFCAYRNRLAKKGQSQEEIASLRENQQIWGCYSVLNILYSLIQRSQMNEQLAAIKRGEDPK
ncbi:Eukaryotic translation initiation factor 3 subunit L [Orbilia oligospora]|uniref:Eukaryotic translation initiation factor 3 subunit L n=1 Tax=Orbilia oligospora TaxID=2813651 RepID=A0A6G1LQC4_ORBOL|nr:Eukaryotic translation initiation factor 3 subunit L [Orbilia oligospora]KAF3195021.1 Eukaryotic translation initiation factor 3 subunit L [Orbilia oligospora]KAF3200192.1 Eukaryotic translation initiation factor 3 subunit L [Orbilia oligospora]KAF3230712.1 Eukaryotic translation initiation factor 3 subunit L [Orbilia oligospora]KAF3230976.1 Eukaryotic translation initiation factor 3 subunit L [Orbilia oligospora]